MGVKKHIVELLNTRKDIYKKDPRIIIEDYRREQEKIDEYNGRQLLELLQNADDAAFSAENKCCFISLTDNKLIVANNGEPFTREGIESLMYSNLSPKMKEQNKIGQKGLGFRSILSWANSVTIKSADFAVEFSKDIALDFLQEVKKNNCNVDEIIKSKISENEKDTIAILRCPKVLDDIPSEYSKYDTYIVVELKKNQINNVIKQIEEELDMEVLLFLNNLETISVEYHGDKFILQKTIDEKNITITRTNGKGPQSSKTWNIKTLNGTIEGIEDGKSEKKNYEIKIAWTDQLDDQKNTLYSYFRTNVRFPFPALVHATFDLTSDRNHLLPHNTFNEGVKASLKDFLIEVAATLASQGDISYNALKLLCVENNDILIQSDLVDRIKTKYNNQKIFPTAANEYISYNDNPVFLQYDYASFIVNTEKNKFKTLLQFSDDPSVLKLLGNIGVIKTPDDEIIYTMSELTLEKESRARLIYWLALEKYEERAPESLVRMLIDANGTKAAQGDVVFLPPAGVVSLVIPNHFKLKIMDAELYEKLKELFGESKAEVMADRMKQFCVMVYRFGDIFSRLTQNKISQFNKDFILKLYDLYISNKDSGADITIPSNQNIYVLNRKGNSVKTSDAYFGREYGNTLCEQLYQYDQGKFIASTDILGLEKKEFVNDFLSWLGVAEKPRYILVELNNEEEKKEYAKYVFLRFPYETKRIYWNDPSINSYTKLEQKGYDVQTIKVTSIDGLVNVLQNSSIEQLLTWLIEDKRIENDKELLKESSLKYYVRNKQYLSEIKCEDMPSYLLWKLPQIQWIKTINNNKVAPCRCCISKTITEDFSPLIEVPLIDYKLLSKYSRQDVEYFLHKIGVKTEIREFSQQVIYSLLIKLAEIDNDGKKARLLYKELVENLNEEDIDESLPERKDFLDNVKVFCKQGEYYSYEPVKEVYYLQDKIYGENIVNQFKIIAIDRRRNSTIIKRLFGVEPLANLKFSLKGNIKVNESLNVELQKELHNLTPYVYALRNYGSKAVNFNKLGDEWIVQVCSEIFPVYKKKDGDEETGFVLNDYEFIYVSEKNTYYVLIKDSGSTTLSELRSDYKFVDIVSEIYSNILKVDSIRPIVSRLFEADTKKRDHILQTEIDDSAARLKEARRQLNIVNDQKVLFWLGVLEILEEEVEYKEYEKTDLDDLVKKRIKIQIDDYSLNYSELSSENCSVSEIKKLFGELHIDIASFNNHSSCNLDLVPYYKKHLEAKKIEKESIFEQLLYEQLKDKTVEDKKSFLDTIKNYRVFRDFNVANSINVELDTILNTTVLEIFKVDLTKSKYQSDIKSIYDNNYIKLMEISELNCEVFKTYLNDNDEIRSLVYFAEYDAIKNNYLKYKESMLTENGIHFNGKQIKGNDLSEMYRDLIKQDDFATAIEIKNIKTEKSPVGKHNESGRNGGNHTSKKRMSEKRKKQIGFIGEVLVYKTLKECYEVVSWDSGYAKEVNENPVGDDMNHYDIRYKKDDEYYYVEVKSTTTDNLEFEISKQEFEFGKEKKNNYEIFIVTNVESQKREIKNIGNPFIFVEGESLMNCPRFTVLNDTFTIKMKEKK